MGGEMQRTAESQQEKLERQQRELEQMRAAMLLTPGR